VLDAHRRGRRPARPTGPGIIGGGGSRLGDLDHRHRQTTTGNAKPPLAGRTSPGAPETGLPGSTLSVVNAGLGGNRVLAAPGPKPFLGGVGGARTGWTATVLTESGVRAVILLEGLSTTSVFDATSSQIIAGYQQIVSRAANAPHGLPVFRGHHDAVQGTRRPSRAARSPDLERRSTQFRVPHGREPPSTASSTSPRATARAGLTR